MKRILLLFSISLFSLVNAYAYRVYPTIAQDLRMLDKSNYPFIAENADGFNVQHDSFTPFSSTQVATIFEQFKNKKFINHGIFKGQDITKMGTNDRVPNFEYFTAMMLYNEAPAMSITDWEQALAQNPPFPLITHCRSFDASSRYDKTREEILMSSGIMFEFQVTKPDKFDDAAALLKYCVDNDRMLVLLTTFQLSPRIYMAAYKELFYYLKENLDPKYLNSDHLIFIPNTYEDTQVFPETLGYGSTFGVAHWLIDQKSKVNDGYIQPKISITNLEQNQYFENHSSIQVQATVNHTDLRGVELYINDALVGMDSIAPYSWSGGLLSDLTTGYKELRAVAVEQDGTTTEAVVQIEILQDMPVVPGYFDANRVEGYQLRNTPLPEGYIRHVYAREWIDYKVDVQHDGLYDVLVNLRIQRSKQYGGSIIIKKGNTELGRFTTITNDPDKDPLPGFVESPNALIKNVPLEKGVQTLRVTFSHPKGITKPQFYLYGFTFIKQGGPTITVSEPAEIVDGYYGSYAAPANLTFAASAKSTRDDGRIDSVSLYLNNKLVSSKTKPPYEWNKSTVDSVLCGIPQDQYKVKMVATDELGYRSFQSFDLSVYDRKPFNPNMKIPGKIEAWEFDIGGEGIGYHEEKQGNERGLQGDKSPRFAKTGMNEDIEVENYGSDYVVSAVRDGEWLNYTIADVEPGIYNITVNTAANDGKYAEVKVYLQNKLLGLINTEPTGGFRNYKNFTVKDVVIKDRLSNAQLFLAMSGTATTHLFYFRTITFTKTREYDPLNLKRLSPEFDVIVYPVPAKSSFIVDLKKNPLADIFIYDINGQLLYENYEAKDKIQVHKHQLNGPGIYVLKIRLQNNGIITKKIVISE